MNKNNKKKDIILPDFIFINTKFSQNSLILWVSLTILFMIIFLLYCFIGTINIELKDLRDFSNFAINIYFVIAALLFTLPEINENRSKELKLRYIFNALSTGSFILFIYSITYLPEDFFKPWIKGGFLFSEILAVARMLTFTIINIKKIFDMK